MSNGTNDLLSILSRMNATLTEIMDDVDILKLRTLEDGYKIVHTSTGAQLLIACDLEDYIQREIYRKKDFYELGFLKALDVLLKDDSVIVDVGANIGNHSIYWLSKYENSYVYSFEPVKKTFNSLSNNINLNGFTERSQLFNIGLSNKAGFAKINAYSPKNVGATQIINDDNGDIEIQKLDNIQIDKTITLLKIDVEGFESAVLEGAENLIHRDLPVIYIEIFDEHYEAVSAQLSQLGYKLLFSLPECNYIWKWRGI